MVELGPSIKRSLADVTLATAYLLLCVVLAWLFGADLTNVLAGFVLFRIATMDVGRLLKW